MGCGVSKLDRVLSNKDQLEMIALLMIEDGLTMQPELIEAAEIEAHNAAAKAHFNMG